jgi:mono/diheme cytochrome c family protein
MHDQPKMYPQRGAALFADGRSARPQVPGTVARSQGKDVDYINTGLIDGQMGNAMPFPVTMDVLARGQERFNVYCTPCHSRVGNGKGMIVDRGYYPATSFHSERLRQAPLGYFFKVMTEGYGAMPSYHSEVTVQDRWAIVAYIRALQLSQNAHSADVPAGKTPARLLDVVSKEGFPEGFMLPWGMKLDARVDETPSAVAPPAPIAAVAPVEVKPVAAKAPGAVVPAESGAKTAPDAKTIAAAKTTTVASNAPAPVKAAAVPAAPKADAAAGKTIYMTNCSMCHQPTRAGLPPVFPSLLGIVERTGPAHIRESVQQGKPQAKPPMPAFTQLSAQDIDNLIEFLRTK